MALLFFILSILLNTISSNNNSSSTDPQEVNIFSLSEIQNSKVILLTDKHIGRKGNLSYNYANRIRTILIENLDETKYKFSKLFFLLRASLNTHQ